MQTEIITTTAVAPIAALTVAAEFLMCAVRAMACGAEVDSREVQQPLQWAASKMVEAGITPSLR